MKKYIIITLYTLTLFISNFAYGQTNAPVTGEYTVLTPLPGTTIGGCTTINCKADINSYLSGLLGLLISIGAVLAMVYLGLYGFQYATTDNVSKKSESREKLWEIFEGLLLILTAYTIISTINPDLVKIDLEITSPKSVAFAPTTTTSGGSTTGGTAPISLQQKITETCPNCGPLTGTSYTISEANIQRLNCTTCAPMGDLPVASNNLNKNLEPDMKNRLAALNYGLGQQKINWGVTEAYPPVTNHENNCHYNGTCIDAKVSDATAQNIRAFIATASNNNLRAQLEFATDTERDAMRSNLMSLGMSQSDVIASVITVKGINGSHFSVYKK